MNKADPTVYEVDLLRIAKAVLRHIWAVILAIVIFGASFFCYAAFFITPMYTANGMFYVNSTAASLGTFSISSADLATAKSLVNTYIVILESRNTLDEVIEKADLPYSYDKLASMVSASAVSNTEVFRISVTAADPNEARDIVNTIAEVLPEKIESVVSGTSMRVVDYAVTPAVKSSPSITRYTAIGILVGAALSIGLIIVLDILDDYVHGQDDLLQSYDLPVLASIPDLSDSSDGSKNNKYYSDYSRYGKTKRG